MFEGKEKTYFNIQYVCRVESDSCNCRSSRIRLTMLTVLLELAEFVGKKKKV